MSKCGPSRSEDALLNDLLRGLSSAHTGGRLSLGVLGSAVRAPQPPAHCLRVCLNGDPHAINTRGCAFLQAAHGGTLPPASEGGCCPKGFQVGAQAANFSGGPATIVSVEGPLAGAPDSPTASLMLAHLDRVARLVQRISDLLEENAGFANEVLQNYEQLNLIFDLTQQIVHVTEARAIERLLLQRTARLLNVPVVLLLTSSGERRAYAVSDTGALNATPIEPGHLERLLSLAGEIRRTRQVRVCELNGRRVIAGPLVRLDEQVDVVLAERPADRQAFSAGEMMLLESVLAFGGQILANTELHERLRRMSLEVTHAMVAAIDKKDHYTSGHSERVGFLTRLTAAELGVPPAEQQTMEWAGLLHDIGKIGIPEEILCKPGKLTPEEFEIIKQHPRMGYEILRPIASLGVILDGVQYHHEYPDGSGYPEGLKGDRIPLVARIIHVADMFDALTSSRSYRQAHSVERATEIIRQEAGKRVDPRVAEALFRAFARYCREDPEDFALRFPHLAQKELAYAEHE